MERCSSQLGGASLLALLLASAYPCPVAANPTGGAVSAGSASIASSGSTLTVAQSSNKAIIDWRGFDIASGETTQFVQPSSSSVTLNRVNSASASVIDGALKANGNIVIVNPNGILFGKNSVVDVNGLLATTADIGNDKFMSNTLLTFDKPGNANATVENRGLITAREAGLVGLVAPNVLNSGVINAKLGRIHLASGDTATVDLYGDGLMEVAASAALKSQLVDNTGSLNAEGGTIALTAAAAAETVNSLIHVGGTLNATGVGSKGGTIYLYGEGSNAVAENITANKGLKSGSSILTVDGTLDASNATGSGGKITATADHVTLAASAKIKANGKTGGGTILIGGGAHGTGTTPAALSVVLEKGAFVEADALDLGDGGNISLWADNFLTAKGLLQALGGASSGNGGSIETSGKIVDFAGLTVNASAAKGTLGAWLIDPTNLTIDAAAAATIATNLASSNVTLQTNSDGSTSGPGTTSSGNGNIIVSSAITASGTGSLTLSAYYDVVISGAITLNGGALLLRSNNADAGAGSVVINSSIATAGGNITIGGGSGTITAGSGYAYGTASHTSGVSVVAAVSAGGGNIIINGASATVAGTNEIGVSISGATVSTTGSGTITMNGTSSVASNSGYSNIGLWVVNGGVVSAQNGTISLTGVASAVSTGQNWGLYVLPSGSSTVKTTGTGNILLTGTAGNSSSANHGVAVTVSGGVNTAGTGSIIVKGINAGTGSFTGVYVPSSNGIVSTGGAVSVYADSIALTATNAMTAATTISVASYTNGALGIGTGTTGTLILSDVVLADMIAPSLVFGAMITGDGTVSTSDVTVKTAADFANRNVTVISGNNIILSSGLTKATGTGTANYTFQAKGDIYNSSNAGISAATGAINLTLQSDYDASGAGAVYLSGGTISTNGGSITIGGGSGAVSAGSGYAYGDATYAAGVTINDTLSASGGNIIINGKGYTAGTGTNNIGVNFNGTAVSTTGSGTIAINGTGGGTSTSTGNFGIYVANGAAVSTANGALSITGTGSTSTGAENRGMTFGGGGTISSVNGNITIVAAGGNNGMSGHGFIMDSAGTVSTSGTGNISIKGTGGTISGNGIYIGTTGSVHATGSGSIILTGIKTYSASQSVGSAAANAIKTASGSITIYANDVTPSVAGAINSGGLLTIAPYSNVAMGVGTSAGGTLNLTDTQLSYLTAASYAFGALTTGNGSNSTINLTVNTSHDFGNADVTFISGQNINLAGALTKASGSGTANYIFYANGDIYNSNSAGVTATAGTINLTLQADYNANNSGAVYLSGGTISTNGGNITIGGGSGAITAGSGFAGGDSAYVSGVTIANSLNAGGGNIVINGTGYTTGPAGSYFGVDVNAGSITTSGSGTISIYGIGGGTGTSAGDKGVYVRNSGAISTVNGALSITGVGGGGSGTEERGVAFGVGTISSVNGNITVTGTGGALGTSGTHGVILDSPGSITTSGSGNIFVMGYVGGGWGVGVYSNQANSIVATGTGSITIKGVKTATADGVSLNIANAVKTASGSVSIYTDKLAVGTSGAVNSGGVLTIAPYTDVAMGVGTAAAGTLTLTDTVISYLTAPSFVFGSLTVGNGAASTGLMTVNTAANLGTSNVTFVSGGSINLAGTLTKSSGTGSVAYVFEANGDIYNSNSAGIAASAGVVNLILQSDYDASGAGAVNLTGGTFATNGGNITIGGGSGTIAAGNGYAVSDALSYAGALITGTINAGGGNVVINGKSSASYGVGAVINGGSVSTTGSGTVTISGVSTGTASANDIGLWIVNGGSLSAQNGSVTLTGVATTANTGTNWGVYVSTAGNSTVKTTGAGSIYVTGSASGASVTNYSIGLAVTNSIQAAGTGSVVLFDTTSAVISASVANAVHTASGSVTVYANSLSVTTAGAINSGGVLTIAPYTDVAMGVGTAAAGTLTLTDTVISYLTAPSFVFGSLTVGNGAASTGLMTVNTAANLGTSNVTFVSGSKINLAGTLTKTSGTGSVNYIFEAKGDIYNSNSAGVSATAGAINLTLQSDYDANGSGAVSLTGGAFTTNGGNITIGGGSGTITAGSGYAAGNGTYFNGVNLTGALAAGGGDIVINGMAYTSGLSTNASGIQISSGSVTTTGSGAITLNGIANISGNSGYNNIGVFVLNSGVVSTQNGLLSVTGVASAASSGANWGVYVCPSGSPTLETTGSGNIVVTGTAGNSTATNYAVASTVTDGIYAAGTGNITIYALSSGGTTKGILANSGANRIIAATGSVALYADDIALANSGAISAGTTLTIAPYTATTMGVGSAATGTLLLSDTALAGLSAPSYVFGSLVAGNGSANTNLLTINTTADFGNSNVTFVSGGNINLAGTLTKASGTGTATYSFLANNNVTNTAGAGVVATAGKINLAMTSDVDYATSVGGSITLTNAPLNVNGGTISLASNGNTVTQSGSIGGDENIVSGNGAVSLGTLDGDSIGIRSLIVDAGTSTVTTTGVLGGTKKLNNLTLTADDVALGANVFGSGTLTLQTTTNNRAIYINYGTSDGSNFNLSTTELGYLQNGWGLINVGKASGATAYTEIGSSTWVDPVTFRGYYSRVYGALAGQDNAAFTFNNDTEFHNAGSSITTQGGSVVFNAAFATYSNNSSVTTNSGALTISGSLSGQVAAIGNTTFSTAGGNISLASVGPGIVSSGSYVFNAGTGSITVGGAVNTAANVSMTGASINLGAAWGASTALGNVSLTSANSLTLPSITAASITVVASGASADLTVASGKILTGTASGTAVTLSAARNFINNAGSGAVVTSNGRWVVYSAAPAGDTFGNLDSGNTAVWNATYGGSIAQTGNRYVFAYQPTLTFTSGNISKVYGIDNTTAVAADYTISGLQAGVAGAYQADTNASVFSGTVSSTSAGATSLAQVVGGPYVVSLGAGSLSSLSGYAFSYNSAGVLTITPATLTGTIVANNKVYDGTTAATLASLGYTGTTYGSDAASLTVTDTSATFNSKNVASATTVTASGLALSGSAASNYQLASTSASAAASITPATLTGVIVANNKVYDGTTAATLASLGYTGTTYGSDAASLTVTDTSASFNSKNVASATTVTASGLALSGSAASNYQLASTSASAAASITSKGVVVTANNQTITQGAAVPADGVSYNGFVSGEGVDVLLTLPVVVSVQNGTPQAGTYAGNYTVSGASATNYSFSYVAGDLLVQAAPVVPVAPVVVVPSTVVANSQLPVAVFSVAIPLVTVYTPIVTQQVSVATPQAVTSTTMGASAPVSAVIVSDTSSSSPPTSSPASSGTVSGSEAVVVRSVSIGNIGEVGGGRGSSTVVFPAFISVTPALQARLGLNVVSE